MTTAVPPSASKSGTSTPVRPWSRPAVLVERVDLSLPARAVAAAAGTLSASELSRADLGTADVRRRRVLLRAALRRVLGEVLGVAPADVPLVSRPGRPELEVTAARPDVDLNCSASGDLGLVAVVRGGQVGIDVEQVLDEDVESAVAEGWLAGSERCAIARLPAAEQSRALTRAWVQKEAVLKGQGVGLRADLATTLTRTADIGRIDGWSVSPVAVPSGFVASVACRAAQPWARRLRPRISVR